MAVMAEFWKSLFDNTTRVYFDTVEGKRLYYSLGEVLTYECQFINDEWIDSNASQTKPRTYNMHELIASDTLAIDDHMLKSKLDYIIANSNEIQEKAT